MEFRDTETHCHCGTAWDGSDHCPRCFCEIYESQNCSTWCGESNPPGSTKSEWDD